jgi:hypothetical protein
MVTMTHRDFLDGTAPKIRIVGSTGPTRGTNSVGLQKRPRKALYALLPIVQRYSKSTWMASARVWIVDENGKSLSSNYTINSWHKEQTSLEATAILHVPKHSNFTTVNVELIAGTSHASQKDSENGVDKFKLLGLISC